MRATLAVARFSAALGPRWALAGVFIGGLLVRLPALASDWRITNDVEVLGGWLHVIAERGLILAYQGTTVNYPPVFVYWLWLAARVQPLLVNLLPALDSTTLLVKLPALVADLLLAGALARALKDLHAWGSVAGAAAYLFNPAMWYVSNAWGQPDAVYVLFLVLAVIAVQRSAYLPAWVLLALSIATKPQAVCLAPLLLVATWRARGGRGLVMGLAACGAVLALLWAPWLLAGQWASLRGSPLAPLPQQQLSVTAYNAWYLWRLGAVSGFDAAQSVAGWPLSHDTLARLVYVLIAGGLALLAWLRVTPAHHSRGDAQQPLRPAHFAAVLALAFFLFMPDLRERYLFPLPPLLLLALAEMPPSIPLRRWWLVYGGVSALWLFNLVTIGSSVAGWWVNLVVPQPETPLVVALRLGALGVAALLLLTCGWLVRLMFTGPRPP